MAARNKDDRLRGDIIATVRAVTKKSILMQITKAKVANGKPILIKWIT
jgi:hypothetical protein